MTNRGGRWRKHGLAAFAVATGAALVLPSCHVFTSLENCSADRDCALGLRCNSERGYCEVDRGPIKLGAMMPLSGALTIGQPVVDGMQFAVDAINAEGGVAGRRIELRTEDDQSSEQVALSLVRRFVDDRVAVVIGPLRSAQVLAAAPVSFAAGLLQITPYAGASSLAASQPERDRYLFQTITSIRRGSAQTIAMWAGEGSATVCKNMVIVHSSDTTGQDYADAVSDLLPTHGKGCVRQRVSIPPAPKEEYAVEIDAILTSSPRPNCGVLVSLPTTAARFLDEFRRTTAKKAEWASFVWVGTSSLRTPAFLTESKLYATNPAEGVLGADVDYEPATPEFKKFREVYNRFRQVDVDAPVPVAVPNAFDAIMLSALAIERAGGTASRARIRDGLFEIANDDAGKTTYGPTEFRLMRDAIRRGERVNYQGASSRIQFDTRGVVTNGTLMWKVDKGAFVTQTRYDEATMAKAAEVPLTGACD